MRYLVSLLLLISAALAQTPVPQLSATDAVRIREFYRLAPQIEDKVWPNWSSVPDPLLLVTKDTEFLTHHPNPPKDFKKISDDLYARPRQFPTGLLATFPAFGPPDVIVIGEAENTEAKASTPWLITLMHEHFHQLQDSQPGIFEAMNNLGLAHGDQTGMWMLNYRFPYDKPEVDQAFTKLRDLLYAAVEEPDDKKFSSRASQYIAARKAFLSRLSPDDAKYFNFQLWKEGIARYVQIKSAEAAAQYEPTPEYAALPDYESFAAYATHVRRDTLNELKQANLARMQRVVVYSFGASEGLFLDRLNPGWKESYLKHLFTLDPYFEKH